MPMGLANSLLAGSRSQSWSQFEPFLPILHLRSLRANQQSELFWAAQKILIEFV
jgi:hypothetical protein